MKKLSAEAIQYLALLLTLLCFDVSNSSVTLKIHYQWCPVLVSRRAGMSLRKNYARKTQKEISMPFSACSTRIS